MATLMLDSCSKVTISDLIIENNRCDYKQIDGNKVTAGLSLFYINHELDVFNVNIINNTCIY